MAEAAERFGHDAADLALADLARLSYPSVSKSCLSHRLKKILTLMPEEQAEREA